METRNLVWGYVAPSMVIADAPGFGAFSEGCVSRAALARLLHNQRAPGAA